MPDAEASAESGQSAETQDPYCLTDADADAVLQGAPWRRFVVLGDSLAEGLGEPTPGYRSIPWADRTHEALLRQQPELAYLNLGLRDLLAGEIREQQVTPALEFTPDLAAVVCGGNDMFRSSFDPDKVEAEIEGIIAPLRESGAQVVTYCLMNITKAFPRLAFLEPKLDALNQRIRLVADRNQALLVDMWEHPACSDPGLFASDKVHSSMRGHAVLGSETIRRLGEHLAAGPV
jgi:lysophospholipase L1-like esterase